MKTIALVPVRNDAWVLEHSLACWSGFCDVVIVSDQDSTDGAREIYRRFPKVVVLETPRDNAVAGLPQQARWRLLDAARGYDGHNLLWCTDADELTLPSFARAFITAHAADLVPGRVVECRFYNLWKNETRYRDDLSQYGPHWKAMGFVDDRVADYPRDPSRRPLHEPRMAIETDPQAIRTPDVPVLHLQWVIWNRNQLKQAWYRCIELMDRRMTAVQVNAAYQVTLPPWRAHTEPIPDAWRHDTTLPSAAVADRQPSWHEADLMKWFDERGIEFFEGLEIWHVPSLRREFKRRTGRQPHPDRSYRPPVTARAARIARLALNAVKRRVLP